MKHHLAIIALPLFTLLIGCKSWPEPIRLNQVDLFKEADKQDPGLHEDARACASRLNGHRLAAKTATTTKTILTGLGGLTSGTGGIVAGVVDASDTKTVGAVTAAIGGGVVLLGNFAVDLLADPTDRLTRHGNGLASWDAANRAAIALRGAQSWTAVRLPINMKLTKWEIDLSAYDECEIPEKDFVSGDWWDAGDTSAGGNKRQCAELKFAIIDDLPSNKKQAIAANPDGSTADNFGTCILQLSCDTHAKERKKNVALIRSKLDACVNDRGTATVPADVRTIEVP